MKIIVSERLRQALDKIKVYFTGKISELAQTTSEAVQEVAESATTLKGTTTLSASNWNLDSTAIYPYYYDITNSAIKTTDRVDVVVQTSSLSVAGDLCMTTESYSGKVRIRAQSAPSTNIAIQYWIIR